MRKIAILVMAGCAGSGQAPAHTSNANGSAGPSTPDAAVSVANGRMPPEVIQHIVRQHYSEFRACYERGLGRDPNLQGRVTIRFIIGRDGKVSNPTSDGSTMEDTAVVECIVRGYLGITFPQPEGGLVTVVYPIMFLPVEPSDAGDQ